MNAFLSSSMSKIGSHGESFVAKYLSEDYIIKGPVLFYTYPDGSWTYDIDTIITGNHSCDFVALSKNNEIEFFGEVKTQLHYPYTNDTGIKTEHNQTYLKIAKYTKKPVNLYFVDWHKDKRNISFSTILELNKEIKIRNFTYPRIIKKNTYKERIMFPQEKLDTFRTLKPSEIFLLKTIESKRKEKDHLTTNKISLAEAWKKIKKNYTKGTK